MKHTSRLQKKGLVMRYGKNSTKRYDLIYADPPWNYYNDGKGAAKKGDHRFAGGVAFHYQTMKLEEICELKIPSTTNCVLYLWATAPKLPDAMVVMEAWGFKYKTQAMWDKGWIGVGYWFRGQHELLLVGVKGKVSPPPSKARHSSVMCEKRTRHSRKPDLARKIIEDGFPDATKLEMFARESFPGWDRWGNE